MNVDWKPHRGEGAHVSGLAFVLRSCDFCFISASKPPLLRSSWNRKDFNHPSCCQRTLWVTDLFFVVFFLNSLQYVHCSMFFVPLFLFWTLSCCVSHQAWAVSTEGAGAECFGWTWNPGYQGESEELCSAHCSWDASRVSGNSCRISSLCFFLCIKHLLEESVTLSMCLSRMVWRFSIYKKRLKPMTFPRALIFCLQRKAMSSF